MARDRARSATFAALAVRVGGHSARAARGADGAHETSSTHPLTNATEHSMSDDALFPSSSTRETMAFCWEQVGPYKRSTLLGWLLTIVATGFQSVAGPIIFAALLTRVAQLPPHASFGSTFEPLVIAYGVVLVLGTITWRCAGWVEWGASLRAFANALTNGYDHLITLSHRWHSDRPAGEVIS